MKLRVLTVEDWPHWRGLRLTALSEAPQAFGSKLSDWQGEGDTAERWRNRLASVPLNVIADLDGEAAAMVSATAIDEDGSTELISMWVAPFARGRGIGDLLVRAVLDWAKEQGARRIVLDVVETNEHAIRLYNRHGFVDSGSLQDIPDGDSPERRMVRNIAIPTRPNTQECAELG